MWERLKSLPVSVRIAAGTIVFIGLFLLIARYADTQLHDYGIGIVDTNSSAHTSSGIEGILHSVTRWDANHYAYLVEHGYDRSETAFFPLYPLIATGIHNLGVDTRVALLAVSWSFTILAAIVLFFWAKFELAQRRSRASAWTLLVLLALFPTSFFLAAGYTESLFMFLSVSALYAYRTRHFVLSGIAIALLTATRVQGGALAFLFLFDYLWARRWADWKKLIPVVMAPLGLLSYMGYLWVVFGNPFQFIEAQHGWGRFNGNPIQNLISSFTPVYLWFLPVLAGGLWLIYRYLGLPWLIYSALFIAMPLSSGRLDSLNRYMLALPPLFLALTLYSQRAPDWVKILYISSSVFLLAWGIILFSNNYWVA
jgi:Gpi18-like mannosyltransferase